AASRLPRGALGALTGRPWLLALPEAAGRAVRGPRRGSRPPRRVQKHPRRGQDRGHAVAHVVVPRSGHRRLCAAGEDVRAPGRGPERRCDLRGRAPGRPDE
ncbi:MAG: hypothetical protein AVDCRST_MAG24-1465, partial [uncultured Nocardioidaceae bacterium]